MTGGLIRTLSKLPNLVELDARLVDIDPNPLFTAREVLAQMVALPFVILA